MLKRDEKVGLLLGRNEGKRQNDCHPEQDVGHARPDSKIAIQEKNEKKKQLSSRSEKSNMNAPLTPDVIDYVSASPGCN